MVRGISAARRRARPGKAVLILAVAIGVVVLAGLYGRIMGYDLRRDEFMFVPPAELLGQYVLYGDLFYNHVPYSAWAFRVMHQLLPWLGLLEAARLTIFLCWLLLLGGAAWIGWRLTRSVLVAVVGPVSLITADVLLGQTGMAATNNLMPLPFALLGLGLFAIAIAEQRQHFGQLLLSGVLLSIAAGLKASAIAFVPAVAIGCFLVPRRVTFAERLRHVVLPVALGGLIGAAPLIWYALTQPDLFFAHILGYHSGPHVAYWQANAESEPDLALSGPAKLQLAYSVWMVGATLLALFLAVLARVLSRRVEDDAWSSGASEAATVVALSVLTAALLAFVPTPGFPQYYAAPLIGPPILIALLCRAMPVERLALMRPAMAVAIALMAVYGGPRILLGLNDLRHPNQLTTARVQRGGDRLREKLAEAGLDQSGPIATLSPLYPLAAGLPIYPEFSAGPFAYRVAIYTSPELRALYSMAGAEDLPALFDATPPAAILTGFDPVLEAPFEDYARAHGYTLTEMPKISDRYGSARLWLPAPAAASPDQTGARQ